MATFDGHVLQRYVPRLASEWNVEVPDRPWQEIESTLCFVDLSGFTALSERLARRGRIGAEELTEVLNRVFSSMLEIAYDRGGALLKFGGDALLLHFTGSDHPVHAACAAVEMRVALREAAQIPTSVGRVALRMSVGIHTGTVHLFRVGSSHRELVITGPAATRVELMESEADAGEILVSPETAHRLPAAALGAPKGPGVLLRWRRAPVPSSGVQERRAVESDAVASCLPVVLRHHLADGAVEPEHRLATVGFVKYSGIDALMRATGPAGVAEALHRLVSCVQHAADSERVTFLATDLDKDGGKVILTAGVPATLDDDDGRMMRTVRTIAEAELPFVIRIGVHRGHVFAGEVGGEHRATFTVMGDTVNIAARLMASAGPGELYASPDVLDRSRTLFDAQPLPPLTVKGKSKLVHAYVVGPEVGPRPVDVSSDHTTFAGRDRELAVLGEAIERARAGRGRVVRLLGPTGVGKTRLIAESLTGADDLSMIAMRAEQIGATAAYRALRDPIRQLLRIERAEATDMAEQLRQAVAERAPALLSMLPLLGDVVHVDTPPTPQVDRIELRFRPDRTADALVALLDASGRQPIAIVIDDAQWLDSASTALIERLAVAARDRSWLMIIARRPETGGADPPADDDLDIQPLAAGDARAVVLSRTSAAPLRPHEVDLIVERSGGNPLFLSELIRTARSAGTDELPESLNDVVNAELDALGGLSRRLIRYASVLGNSFRIPVLRAVLASERIELDDAAEHDLSRFLEQEGSDRLRFRHAMLRDVVYEGLPYRRRRELHLRAGEITETMAGGSPETVADVLAMHYALAQEPARAWRYARIAGERAQSRYANIEAITQFERAIEAARRLDEASPAELAEVWRMLGDVREQLALYDDAVAAYRRASALLADDTVGRADLLWRRARARMHLGAYRSALAEATRGRRLLDGLHHREATASRARLAALQALLRQAQQQAESARRLAVDAVIEAESADDGAALARAYLVLDWANRVLGRQDDSYGERALSIYEDLGDLDGAGNASNNLGGIAYFDGHWIEAERWYRRALTSYRRCGNDANAAVSASNLAELLVSRGAFEEAAEMLNDSIRVLRSSRALDDLLFAEMQLGRLLLERGDHAEAAEHLAALRDQAAAVGQSGYAFEAATLLASALVELHRHDEAIATLDAAAAAAGFVDPVYQPALCRARALALAGLGDLDGAAASLEAGVSSARQQGLLYEEGLLLLTRLRLDREAGAESSASMTLDARDIFERLGIGLDPAATRPV